jgi:hypothetical protein
MKVNKFDKLNIPKLDSQEEEEAEEELDDDMRTSYIGVAGTGSTYLGRALNTAKAGDSVWLSIGEDPIIVSGTW